MSERQFITGLYISSSLIQADAAIFALGAIFVIYKLQSLEGAYQSAILGCNSLRVATETVFRINASRSDAERAALLLGFQGSYYQSLLVAIAYTPRWRNSMISGSFIPFALLAIHCSLTATLLLAIPGINQSSSVGLTGLATADVVTFIVIIFFITWKAYQLLAYDEMSRQELFQNIDRAIPEDNAGLNSLLPSDDYNCMYRFKIPNHTFYTVFYRKPENRFSINFMTFDEKERKILSQKSFENKSETELLQILKDYLANHNNILP